MTANTQNTISVSPLAGPLNNAVSPAKADGVGERIKSVVFGEVLEGLIVEVRKPENHLDIEGEADTPLEAESDEVDPEIDDADTFVAVERDDLKQDTSDTIEAPNSKIFLEPEDPQLYLKTTRDDEVLNAPKVETSIVEPREREMFEQANAEKIVAGQKPVHDVAVAGWPISNIGSKQQSLVGVHAPIKVTAERGETVPLAAEVAAIPMEDPNRNRAPYFGLQRDEERVRGPYKTETSLPNTVETGSSLPEIEQMTKGKQQVHVDGVSVQPENAIRPEISVPVAERPTVANAEIKAQRVSMDLGWIEQGDDATKDLSRDVSDRLLRELPSPSGASEAKTAPSLPPVLPQMPAQGTVAEVNHEALSFDFGAPSRVVSEVGYSEVSRLEFGLSTNASVNSSSPLTAQHAAQQIVRVAQSQPGGPVELALNPEELGRVKLTFASHENTLVVTIVGERVDTIDLMRRHIDSLNQEFKNIGYSNVSFNFEHGDGEGFQGGDANGGTNQPVDSAGGDPIDLELSDDANVLTVLSQTGLDIRI